MTTAGLLRDLEMDAPNLEDRMEVGTSPYPHADDIEFELDPIRDPSIDRSMADEGEGLINSADLMQDESENLYNDDEMFDDEALQDLQDPELVDLSMDPPDQHVSQAYDEEILEDYEGAGSVEMAGPQDDNTEHASAGLDDHQAADIDSTVQATEKVDNQDQHSNPTDLDPASEMAGHVASDSEEIKDDGGVDLLETNLTEDVAAETEVVDFAVQEGAIQTEADQANDHPTVLAEPSHRDDTQETTQTLNEQPNDKRSSASPRASGAQSVKTEEDVQEQERVGDVDVGENAVTESEESLHPITIVYMDQEMSLFPPMADDPNATFFLSDSSLAYEPFDKLLASCREILGESLEHDDELVLDIASLSLHICEDSKHASQISLSQVIEVYLHLSHNENIENIEPLYCNLSSRVCLASQCAYLVASAQEGKTFSEITAEYLDSPEADLEADTASHSIPDVDGPGGPDNEATGTEINVQSGARSGAADADQHATQIELVQQQSSQTSGQPESDVHRQPAAPASVILVDQADAGDDLPAATAGVKTDGSLQEDLDPLGRPDDSRDALNEPRADEVHVIDSRPGLEQETASDSSHTVQNESPSRHDTQDYEDVDDVQAVQEEDVNGVNQPDGNENDVYNLEDGFFANETDEYIIDQQDSEELGQLDAVDTTSAAAQENFDEQLNIDEQETAAIDDSPIDANHSNGLVTSDAPKTFSNQTLQLVENASVPAPVTPSKANSNKRKAVEEEEEELDFLDLSTPEPKRTRAS